MIGLHTHRPAVPPPVAAPSDLDIYRVTDRSSVTVLAPLPPAPASPSQRTDTFAQPPGRPTAAAPSPELVAHARLERLRAAGWLEVRRLGQGGMGELFVGYDPGLQRSVVAKFIRSAALSESARKRFRTEAAALARLNHPNVARLFAYVEAADPYLVVEFADGGNLSDLVKAAPLSAREAAALLEATARGVAAAHAAAVIHRDLKPSNILLDRNGPTVVPKVADFGLAKDADAVESLTHTGAVLGTPEYMSPEQAANQNSGCDGRSDVWGLAATLYAAVTGEPPYTRETAVSQVLVKPLRPPEQVTPGLPENLAAVIKKGLEKHPNDRYQTAAEFADDLRRFLGGRPVRACRRAWPVRAWRRIQRLPRGATAAALLVGVALGSLGMILAGDPRPVTARDLRPQREPPDALAELQAEAAKGPVKVVPEAGLPKWHEWKVGRAEVGPTGATDGSAYAQPIGRGVLELYRPTTDRYRVSWEIRQSVPNPNAQGGGSSVGVFLGHQSRSRADGALLQAFLAVEFQDFDVFGKKPPAAFDVAVTGYYFPQRPGRVSHQSIHQQQTNPVRLPAGARLEGVWRRITAEVTPERVRFWVQMDTGAADVGQLLFDRKGSDLNDDAVELRQAFAALNSPNQLPDLMPTQFGFGGGLGVLAYSSGVSFRNVVVTPLPDNK